MSERLTPEREAELRKTYCASAFVGDVRTDELFAEIDALRAENAELRKAVEWLRVLMSESRGVDGYHLNGDVALWDEFDIPDLSKILAPPTPKEVKHE